MEENKKTPLVSIIIPVYNTEKYLKECLDSVTGQTLKDIEIICIDDGSTDGSPAILRGHAAKDGRVKIITQENKGSSAARNAGLDAAMGRYISFVDSDDTQKPDALEELTKTAEKENTDILLFDADVIYDSDEAYQNRKHVNEDCYKRQRGYSGIRSGPDMFTAMMENNEYKCNLYIQLIKAGHIEKHKIRFYDGIIHQDDLFTFQCIMQAERVTHINKTYYTRRIRTGSVVTSRFGKFYDYYSYLEVYDKVRKFVQETTQKAAQDNQQKYSEAARRQIDRYLHNTRNAIAMLYANNEDSASWNSKLSKELRECADEALKPLISVIIPVYNAEPYLRRCLDSVITQTIGLHNLEIIIVNDGSTDGSGDIIKQYKAGYRQIKLIEQENAGLGAARNTAVKTATGGYLAFVDSDDYLPPDAYEKMHNATEDGTVDIVTGRTEIINPDGSSWLTYSEGNEWFQDAGIKEIDTGDITDTMYKDLLRFAGLWCRLFRREFIINNAITCAEGIYFEGYVFIAAAHFLAKKAKVINEIVYNYIKRPDSIMGRACAKRYNDFFEGIKRAYDSIEARNLTGQKHLFDLTVLGAFLPHYSRLAEFMDKSCIGKYSLTEDEYKKIAALILKILENTDDETYAQLDENEQALYRQLKVSLNIIINNKLCGNKPEEITPEEKRPLISVVIPVYNTAPYLRRCIDSIINQTIGFDNLQLIITDDGSTDGSLDIINGYASRYDNIIMIKQKNKGAGAARNSALLQVTGKYLTFSDADDYLPQDAYESMYKAAEDGNTDIVTGRMKVIFPDGAEREIPENIFAGGTQRELPVDLTDYVMCREILRWSGMYLRLYKTGLIINNGIACPEGVSVGNDIGFTITAQFYAKRAKIINSFVYIYVKRDDSSTAKNSKESFIDIFKALDFTYRAIETRGLQKHKKIFDYITLTTHLTHRNRFGEFTGGDCKKLYNLTDDEYNYISEIIHSIIDNADPEAFANLDEILRDQYAPLRTRQEAKPEADPFNADVNELLGRYGAKRVIKQILKTRLYPRIPECIRKIYKKIKAKR